MRKHFSTCRPGNWNTLSGSLTPQPLSTSFEVCSAGRKTAGHVPCQGLRRLSRTRTNAGKDKIGGATACHSGGGGDKMTDTAAVKDGRFPEWCNWLRGKARGAGVPLPEVSPGQAAGLATRRAPASSTACREVSGMRASHACWVQTKARQLSDPGDPMEREAEQFASCECHAGVKCSKCEEKVARSAKPGTAAARGQVSSEVSGEIDSLSGGQELPGHLRERFEPRLGVDLGGVRVHTDSRASRLGGRPGRAGFHCRPRRGIRGGRIRSEFRRWHPADRARTGARGTARRRRDSVPPGEPAACGTAGRSEGR